MLCHWEETMFGECLGDDGVPNDNSALNEGIEPAVTDGPEVSRKSDDYLDEIKEQIVIENYPEKRRHRWFSWR